MTDTAAFLNHITATLQGIEADGLMKRERLIIGAQGAHVQMGGRRMLNLCANNYLGLADDPRLNDATKQAITDHEYKKKNIHNKCNKKNKQKKNK